MLHTGLIIAAYAGSVALVALAWIRLRRQKWQIKWVGKWAHSASPRFDLEAPPPDLSDAVLLWAIGFKRWSQSLQQDLVEIQSQRELAAETGAQTERFHARLRHDLRTPLNAMMGFSDLLLQGIDGPIRDQEKRVIESISASSRALHHRVEEVLSDSIGIALTDRPGDLDEPPSLRFSERPAITYPAPPFWMLPVGALLCPALVLVVVALLIALLVVGQIVAAFVCLACTLLGVVLCWRVERQAARIGKQGMALRDGSRERPKAIAVLDEALRSFEARTKTSRERESTATHFLAERDRKRNSRIARSAATLRKPLDEVRGRTAELMREARLNPKQRDSLRHVLRSANLLNMALEELFLLVDYEGETVSLSPQWVPTVELISKSVARLRHAHGDDVRVEVVVMPGIAPLYLDPTHFSVAFAGLLRFIIKRSEGAGVSIVARFDASHVSIHFQEDRIERHDTIPGRREQELSVLNSGPKLMRLVMEHITGECHYQLEGNLEGWLVFPRRKMGELS